MDDLTAVDAPSTAIRQPNADATFDDVQLTKPFASGSVYITSLILDGVQTPLQVQSPITLTKQGIVNAAAKKRSGSSAHVDLMIPNHEVVFIQWLEKLTDRLRQLLLVHSPDWFEDPLDADDIEEAFDPILKVFKSGKYYTMRAPLHPHAHIRRSLPEGGGLEEVESTAIEAQTTPIISIISIYGIRCTARHFQLELSIKEILITPAESFITHHSFRKIPRTSSAVTDGGGRIAFKTAGDVADSKTRTNTNSSANDAAAAFSPQKENKTKKEENGAIPLSLDDIVEDDDDNDQHQHQHQDDQDLGDNTPDATATAIEIELELDDDQEVAAPIIPTQSPQHQEFMTHFQGATDRINLIRGELAHAIEDRNRICELGQKYGIQFPASPTADL